MKTATKKLLKEIYIIISPIIAAAILFYCLFNLLPMANTLMISFGVMIFLYIGEYITYDVGNLIGFSQGFSYSNKTWQKFFKRQLEGFDLPLDQIVEEIEHVKD